jgi:hypothetical protein
VLPDWLQSLAVPTVEEEPPPPPTTIEEIIHGPAPRVVHARPPRPGAVETFTRLLAQPVPAPVPVVTTTRGTRLLAWLLPDGLVYILLLLVVVGMWVAARSIAPNAALARPSDDATAFHRAIVSGTGVLTPARTLSGGPGVAALPAGAQTQPVTATATLSPALVVFDWDATRYGEMHALSLAVVRDLEAAGRPFASVSLVPQGPAFANAVVREVNPSLLDLPATPNGQYGRRYVNLGYRPGNEAAVRALATSGSGGVSGWRGAEQAYDYNYQQFLTAWDLTRRASSLDQYGLVVQLVSDENNLRLWLEQLSLQTATPIIAAGPMSLRASITPYRDAALAKFTPARLQSAVFGVQGARQLEQQRIGVGRGPNSAQEDLTRQLHTQSATLFAMALILLAGFFYYLYRWMNRPKRAK